MFQLLHRLFPVLNWLLFSSIFISLCAFGLVWETYVLLHEPVAYDLCWMAFFATLFLYNLDSVLPYKFYQQVPLSTKKQWLNKHRKPLLVLALLSLAVAGVLFLVKAPLINFWFLLHLALISVLYSFPFFRKNGKKMPLREVPLLKVFLIAYVWASVTAGLPIIRLGYDIFEWQSLLLFGSRFLFIFSLTLLFDIRDVEKDRLTKTLTFPVWLGIPATKAISITGLTLFSLLVAFFPETIVQAALWLSAVFSALVILASGPKRSDYFFSTFADGMMLAQVMLLYLLIA